MIWSNSQSNVRNTRNWRFQRRQNFCRDTHLPASQLLSQLLTELIVFKNTTRLLLWLFWLVELMICWVLYLRSVELLCWCCIDCWWLCSCCCVHEWVDDCVHFVSSGLIECVNVLIFPSVAGIHFALMCWYVVDVDRLVLHKNELVNLVVPHTTVYWYHFRSWMLKFDVLTEDQRSCFSSWFFNFGDGYTGSTFLSVCVWFCCAGQTKKIKRKILLFFFCFFLHFQHFSRSFSSGFHFVSICWICLNLF